MTTVSDIEGAGIEDFLQSELSDDQSQSFGYFDREKNLVKRFVKSNNSTVPDITLIWDVANSSWLVDVDKFYSCIAKDGSDVYA